MDESVDEGGTGAAGRRRRADYAALNDRALLEVMRVDHRAFQEYFDRFHRILLHYARRAGFPSEQCDEFVEELLDDVALELIRSTGPLPRNVRHYVIGCFRHRFFATKRARLRRRRWVREASSGFAYAVEDASDATAAASEESLRASQGPDWEEQPLPPGLRRLATALSAGLSADERRIVVAVSENVPQRQIAAALGLSYAALRKRLERLRMKLVDAADRCLATMSPAELEGVQRLQRRLRRPRVREEETP